MSYLNMIIRLSELSVLSFYKNFFDMHLPHTLLPLLLDNQWYRTVQRSLLAAQNKYLVIKHIFYFTQELF